MEVDEIIKVLREVNDDKSLNPTLQQKVTYLIDDLQMYKSIVIFDAIAIKRNA